jgi:hypothetical protein
VVFGVIARPQMRLSNPPRTRWPASFGEQMILNKRLPIQITATCTACGASFELPAVLPSMVAGTGSQGRPTERLYNFDLREREYHDAYALVVVCRCGNGFHALREEDFDQLVETPELPFE